MNAPTISQKQPRQTRAGEPREAKPGRALLAVTLARAGLATLLGLALIVNPDKARPMLVNFMGLFWLTSGMMGLRWGVHGERPRPLAIVTGVIGILAGVVILVRNLMRSLLPELTVICLLGGVMVLTGIIHLTEGFPNVREGKRERSWFGVLLGVFEVVLGALVLYTPLDAGRGVYWTATIWSLAGAIWLFSQALVIRAQMRRTRRGEGGASG